MIHFKIKPEDRDTLQALLMEIMDHLKNRQSFQARQTVGKALDILSKLKEEKP